MGNAARFSSLSSPPQFLISCITPDVAFFHLSYMSFRYFSLDDYASLRVAPMLAKASTMIAKHAQQRGQLLVGDAKQPAPAVLAAMNAATAETILSSALARYLAQQQILRQPRFKNYAAFAKAGFGKLFADGSFSIIREQVDVCLFKRPILRRERVLKQVSRSAGFGSGASGSSGAAFLWAVRSAERAADARVGEADPATLAPLLLAAARAQAAGGAAGRQRANLERGGEAGSEALAFAWAASSALQAADVRVGEADLAALAPLLLAAARAQAAGGAAGRQRANFERGGQASSEALAFAWAASSALQAADARVGEADLAASAPLLLAAARAQAAGGAAGRLRRFDHAGLATALAFVSDPPSPPLEELLAQVMAAHQAPFSAAVPAPAARSSGAAAASPAAPQPPADATQTLADDLLEILSRS